MEDVDSVVPNSGLIISLKGRLTCVLRGRSEGADSGLLRSRIERDVRLE